MENWIDRTEAMHRTGVKPQTLYAYVSRGRIAMQPDPADPRRSLYSADDIEALLVRRKRGRKPAAIAQSAVSWGEPVLETAITNVQRGRLFYRGIDAVEFAAEATLEEAAKLLWDAEVAPDFGMDGDGDASPFAALALLAEEARPTPGRTAARLQDDASRAIARLACALGVEAGSAPVHSRLARAWKLSNEAEQAVRRALVLMADHELKPSTFAVRVAASTGASLAASLLAGLSGASAAMLALLRDAVADGAETAIAAWLARYPALPGFGHQLYPSGDPRGFAMVDGVAVDEGLAALRDAVFEMTGALPNLDFGLAVLIRSFDLPADAGFRLFALGRSVGWAAHATEEAMTDRTIRPRAHYVGR
jgi:citrate synthase